MSEPVSKYYFPPNRKLYSKAATTSYPGGFQVGFARAAQASLSGPADINHLTSLVLPNASTVIHHLHKKPMVSTYTIGDEGSGGDDSVDWDEDADPFADVAGTFMRMKKNRSGLRLGGAHQADSGVQTKPVSLYARNKKNCKKTVFLEPTAKNMYRLDNPSSSSFNYQQGPQLKENFSTMSFEDWVIANNLVKEGKAKGSSDKLSHQGKNTKSDGLSRQGTSEYPIPPHEHQPPAPSLPFPFNSPGFMRRNHSPIQLQRRSPSPPLPDLVQMSARHHDLIPMPRRLGNTVHVVLQRYKTVINGLGGRSEPKQFDMSSDSPLSSIISAVSSMHGPGDLFDVYGARIDPTIHYYHPTHQCWKLMKDPVVWEQAKILALEREESLLLMYFVGISDDDSPSPPPDEESRQCSTIDMNMATVFQEEVVQTYLASTTTTKQQTISPLVTPRVNIGLTVQTTATPPRPGGQDDQYLMSPAISSPHPSAVPPSLTRGSSSLRQTIDERTALSSLRSHYHKIYVPNAPANKDKQEAFASSLEKRLLKTRW